MTTSAADGRGQFAPHSAAGRLRRLAGFLYGLAAVIFAGTAIELLLASHWDDPIQVLPFALCAVTLLAIIWAWRRPGRGNALLLRAVMVVTIAASGVGVAQHFWGNHEFARETHPRASELDLLRPSLQGGVPLLAPGVLALGAIVAIAASIAATPDAG